MNDFPSIAEFVYAQPERIYSRERDFGLRWRDRSALYRAAWIEDTGELYLVQLGPPDEGGGRVELLAAGLELEELELALAGWQEAQDDGRRSLEWLRKRLPGIRARRESARALVSTAKPPAPPPPRERVR